MPKIQWAITHVVLFRISSKVNQVIYSSLQINLLSFKALAQTVFEIFWWQGINAAITQKVFFQKFSSRVNQVVYSSLPVYSSSFKALASIVFEIFCWQDCIPIFSKGHNSEKGRNPVKKKNTYQLFFHEEFQNSSIHGSKVMQCIKKRDGRTDEQPRSNIPLQLLLKLGA